MMKNLMMALRYMVAGEESRFGRQDYWNRVYLTAKNPFNRVCLRLGKVLFVVTLCTAMMMVLMNRV